VLLCDASTIGVASVLCQEHEGHLAPVSYHSHRLTAAERNYPITELEGLAMVEGMRHNRHFLLNNPCTLRVLSDHQPLQWMANINSRSGRCSRWIYELRDYCFQCEYVHGKLHDAPDALSRLMLAEATDIVAVDTPGMDPAMAAAVRQVDLVEAAQEYMTVAMATVGVAVPAAHFDDWIAVQLPALGEAATLGACGGAPMDPVVLAHVAEAQQVVEFAQAITPQQYLNCNEFGPLYRHLRGDAVDSSLEKRAADFEIYNGVMIYRDSRVCIPGAARPMVISEMHRVTLKGHRGRDATELALRDTVYWSNMKRDVGKFVAECESCQTAKSSTHKPYGQLQAHAAPTSPFTHYSVDFITGLPPAGPLLHDGICVAVDMFSKKVIAFPIWVAAPGELMAEQFYRTVVCTRGCPLVIVSDRDKRFLDEAFWARLWALHRTQLKMAPAHRQQADGQTERANRTLEEILRCNMQPDQKNWIDELDGAVAAINNAPSKASGMSPFQMEHGRTQLMPFDVAAQNVLPRGEHEAGRASSDDFADHMRLIHIHGREKMVQASRQMELRENGTRPAHEFAPGDYVRMSVKHLNLPAHALAGAKKLNQKYYGPIRVAHVHSPVAIELELPTVLRHIHHTVHPMYLIPATRGGTRQATAELQQLADALDPATRTVDTIMAHRQLGPVGARRTQFLVKYRGATALQAEWLLSGEMGACQAAKGRYARSGKRDLSRSFRRGALPDTSMTGGMTAEGAACVMWTAPRVGMENLSTKIAPTTAYCAAVLEWGQQANEFVRSQTVWSGDVSEGSSGSTWKDQKGRMCRSRFGWIV